MEMTSLSKEVEEVTADDDKEHVETGKKVPCLEKARH